VGKLGESNLQGNLGVDSFLECVIVFSPTNQQPKETHYGHGHLPNTGTTINKEFLKTLPTAGPIFTNLLTVMEENDLEEQVLDDNYCDLENSDDDESLKAVSKLLADFQNAFTADTGLHVYPFYYSDDDGDRYDDLEAGVHWSVAGVYQMTPEAEKIKDHLQDVQWTVWG